MPDLSEDAGASTPDPGNMTIVCWSGDLDRVWPQLILATTGAAYGMQVTCFFTFWGLFTLKRPEVKVTGDTWMTKMLGVFNQENLSHLNFAGAGPRMMRSIAGTHQVTPPEELLDVSQQLGVRLWPCQMTMDMMGLSKDDLIDGLGPPVGAAAAVAEMQRSSINLFI